MKNERQAKLKISNELLDAMLVGVKTQEDLWGKDGIITQINKALLERILNAEMEFHLNDTDVGRVAGNSRNGYGKKNSPEQSRGYGTGHSQRQTRYVRAADNTQTLH